MTRKVKFFGTIICMIVLSVLIPSCGASGTAIILDNPGGTNRESAFGLTLGKWTYGVVTEESPSRWFSIPVTNDVPFNLYINNYRSLTNAGVVYYFQYPNGSRYGPYFSRTWSGTVGITGNLLIEVIFNSHYYREGFAITYRNDNTSPGSPNFWD